MNNVAYQLTFLVTIAASALSMQEEECNILYPKETHELILTSQGGMIKFRDLEGLISPSWAEMKTPEMIDWGSKLLELISNETSKKEASKKLTGPQLVQINLLKSTLGNRMLQLTTELPFFRFHQGVVEEVHKESKTTLEGVQNYLVTAENDLKRFFRHKKDNHPKEIPADVYDGLDAVLSALEDWEKATVMTRSSCLAEARYYEAYGEKQQKEKALQETTISSATTLLTALQKLINKKT